MMRPLNANARIGPILTATAIGFTAVTLFGRPGEVVRPYLIAVKSRVPVSSQVAIWLLERIYDLLMVLLLFGYALTRTEAHSAPPGSPLEWIFRMGGYVVAALAIVCVTLLVMVGSYSAAAQRRVREGLAVIPERYRLKIEGVLVSFAGGMQSTRQRSFVLKVLGYTAAEWIIISACNYCLLKGFSATSHLNWVDNLVFVGFVAFGSAVQVPGIGGGFQVAAVLMLTEFFGVPFESATAIAVVIWAVMYVAIVPVGLLVAVRQGLNWRALRHLSETEQEAVSS